MIILLLLFIIFFVQACAHNYDYVTVYQNGLKLGEWKLCDGETPDGKKVFLHPAPGVELDTMWVKRGAVVVRRRGKEW